MEELLSNIQNEIASDADFFSPWQSSETIDLQNDVDDIVGNGGYIEGSCPVDITVNTGLAGQISFSLQPLCDLAELIKPIVLLIASMLALRIVGRAI